MFDGAREGRSPFLASPGSPSTPFRYVRAASLFFAFLLLAGSLALAAGPGVPQNGGHTDLVLVIDTSASMHGAAGGKNIFWKVKLFCKGLIRDLMPGDSVTLITFAEDVKSWPTITILSGADRSRLEGLIDGLESPGQYTFIAKALQTAFAEVRRLEELRPGNVRSVILLTDGKNDPPPGARKEGPSLEDVAKRYSDRDWFVYLIQLSEGIDNDVKRTVESFRHGKVAHKPSDVTEILQRTELKWKLRPSRLEVPVETEKGAEGEAVLEGIPQGFDAARLVQLHVVPRDPLQGLTLDAKLVTGQGRPPRVRVSARPGPETPNGEYRATVLLGLHPDALLKWKCEPLELPVTARVALQRPLELVPAPSRVELSLGNPGEVREAWVEVPLPGAFDPGLLRLETDWKECTERLGAGGIEASLRPGHPAHVVVRVTAPGEPVRFRCRGELVLSLAPEGEEAWTPARVRVPVAVRADTVRASGWTVDPPIVRLAFERPEGHQAGRAVVRFQRPMPGLEWTVSSPGEPARGVEASCSVVEASAEQVTVEAEAAVTDARATQGKVIQFTCDLVPRGEGAPDVPVSVPVVAEIGASAREQKWRADPPDVALVVRDQDRPVGAMLVLHVAEGPSPEEVRVDVDRGDLPPGIDLEVGPPQVVGLTELHVELVVTAHQVVENGEWHARLKFYSEGLPGQWKRAELDVPVVVRTKMIPPVWPRYVGGGLAVLLALALLAWAWRAWQRSRLVGWLEYEWRGKTGEGEDETRTDEISLDAYRFRRRLGGRGGIPVEPAEEKVPVLATLRRYRDDESGLEGLQVIPSLEVEFVHKPGPDGLEGVVQPEESFTIRLDLDDGRYWTWTMTYHE